MVCQPAQVLNTEPGKQKRHKLLLLYLLLLLFMTMGLPGDSVVKNPPANVGDAGSVAGSERFLEEGNSNPLQYSCLGNPMDRGAWWAIGHRITKKSGTT